MQRFIKCVTTGRLYPVSRVYRIDPVNMEAGPSFCALIENGEDSYTEAYLHDHDVEELQAITFPRRRGRGC